MALVLQIAKHGKFLLSVGNKCAEFCWKFQLKSHNIIVYRNANTAICMTCLVHVWCSHKQTSTVDLIGIEVFVRLFSLSIKYNFWDNLITLWIFLKCDLKNT